MPQQVTIAIAVICCVSAVSAGQSGARLSWDLGVDGSYGIVVDGETWLSSAANATLCVGGKAEPLFFVSSAPASGIDAMGAWTGTMHTLSSSLSGVQVTNTFKEYAASPSVLIATAAFPDGVDVSGTSVACGGVNDVRTQFPSFDTSAAAAPNLGYFSWRNYALSALPAAVGLTALGQNSLDAGPVVAFLQPEPGVPHPSLVWSSLDYHKVVTQVTVALTPPTPPPFSTVCKDDSLLVPTASSASVYSMGLSAAVPSIPIAWNYSIIFSAAHGGPTAATYVYGDLMKAIKNTTRMPSITLTDLGYYTDDGAYYYIWESYNISARPFPAETLLVRVKDDLYARGVPIAYMQLDDWWYNGKFFFGNVKSVTDWHASNASRLFPNGLPSFSSTLNLSLQLYTPFFADDFETPYNMTESTKFIGTKIVTPKDSYNFFNDLFDLGAAQTLSRFIAYEIDFLLENFSGSASMFETVYSASQWYAGLADAAAAHNLAVQFCLCSATDILESLTLPAVVQARASGDYVGKVENAFAIGGSSLLMGALAIAPSKDTLWTSSPQPGTMSDNEHNGLSYTTQPHVVLDSVLATLSLGPVGISDGINQVDSGLIGQAYRSAKWEYLV